MFTRQDYLDHRCTHREYYAQFVTEGIKLRVAHSVGRDRIVKSADEHFNDIPLAVWDFVLSSYTAFIAKDMRERGDYPTPAGMVCVAKEAARQIKEEEASKRD